MALHHVRTTLGSGNNSATTESCITVNSALAHAVLFQPGDQTDLFRRNDALRAIGFMVGDNPGLAADIAAWCLVLLSVSLLFLVLAARAFGAVCTASLAR